MSRASVHAGHPGRYNACQHPDCRTHRARYQKRWHYEAAQGKRRTIDARPAALHIDTLLGAGWSLRSISGASNVPASTLSKIVRREQPTVTHRTAAAILAVDVDQVPAKPSTATTQPFVPRLGVVRRIQALLALGWTHQHISDAARVRSAALLHQQGRWVERATYDRVAALYRDWSAKPGPSDRTRRRAAARGYLPPIAWNDIDHDPEPDLDDDPADGHDYLDEQAIWRRMHGDKTVALTGPEKAELRRRWTTTGRSLNEFERITGINPHRDYEAAS